MKSRGCIYQEIQRNTGRRSEGFSSVRYVRGVGRVDCGRYRWVGVIVHHGKRYRFRSTNLGNVQHWLNIMSEKFSD